MSERGSGGPGGRKAESTPPPKIPTHHLRCSGVEAVPEDPFDPLWLPSALGADRPGRREVPPLLDASSTSRGRSPYAYTRSEREKVPPPTVPSDPGSHEGAM